MNKEIELKWFLVVVVILMAIEAFLIINLAPKKEIPEECKKSVCNADKTLCYKYELDAEGNTKITWRGNCSLK